MRYKSFESQEDFEKELKKDVPEKIDIGAIFSVQVCKSRSGKEEDLGKRVCG